LLFKELCQTVYDMDSFTVSWFTKHCEPHQSGIVLRLRLQLIRRKLDDQVTLLFEEGFSHLEGHSLSRSPNEDSRPALANVLNKILRGLVNGMETEDDATDATDG
jgi:hypothetical protein